MKYRGKDENSSKCREFVKEKGVVKRTSIEDDIIEIFIYTKEDRKYVASIIGFLYDFKSKSIFGKRKDAFHIKTLSTDDEFLKSGFATFLMKEAIIYAEYKNVRCITVNPSACTSIISQEDLEVFYKKFTFEYKSFCLTKEKEIEFESISD